jgi:hypothetical protein
MKTIISRMLIAVVFALAAWFSRAESTLAARVADAKQDMATLNHRNLDTLTSAPAVSDYFTGDRGGLADDIRVVKSTVAYWLGRYGSVVADTTESGADAQILLTAANAAFRESQNDPVVGPAAVQRLDGVLQAYAAALKASPRSTEALGSGALAKEAAYNYEYVARIRDQVARSPQGRIAKSPTSAGPVMGGDLPAGPTIHGGPGAPPPDAKMEELQMIAPMEYGDREAQPEATPGGKRERKG